MGLKSILEGRQLLGTGRQGLKEAMRRKTLRKMNTITERSLEKGRLRISKKRYFQDPSKSTHQIQSNVLSASVIYFIHPAGSLMGSESCLLGFPP